MLSRLPSPVSAPPEPLTTTARAFRRARAFSTVARRSAEYSSAMLPNPRQMGGGPASTKARTCSGTSAGTSLACAIKSTDDRSKRRRNDGVRVRSGAPAVVERLRRAFAKRIEKSLEPERRAARNAEAAPEAARREIGDSKIASGNRVKFEPALPGKRFELAVARKTDGMSALAEPRAERDEWRHVAARAERRESDSDTQRVLPIQVRGQPASLQACGVTGRSPMPGATSRPQDPWPDRNGDKRCLSGRRLLCCAALSY